MNTSNDILFVINPTAGKSDNKLILNEVRKRAKDLSINIEIYTTTGENDDERIYKLLNENDFDRLVVAGGDGTVNEIASTILGRKISLAILPTGSANGLANCLNLPKELPQQLETALLGSTKPLDVLNVNDKVCLHLADLGLNAELIKHYDKSNMKGMFGYMIQGIPTLLTSNHPYQFSIEANGQTIQKTAAMVAIANGGKYGTGVVLCPNSNMFDQKFEIVILKDVNVGKGLLTLTIDKEAYAEEMEVIQADRAIISSDADIDFQLDGEYIGKEKNISVAFFPWKINIVM